MKISRRQAMLSGVSIGIGMAAFPRGDLKGIQLFHNTDNDMQLRARELLSHALNQAASLNCDFADVRLSITRSLDANILSGILVREDLAIGVRVLMNGYWGFCCTPVWNEKNVSDVVRMAYAQAKGNSHGPPREIDVSIYTNPGHKGQWVRQVKYDPFERNPFEFMDYLWGLSHYFQGFKVTTANHNLKMSFSCRELWYAATNGADQYQKLYETSGGLGYLVRSGIYPTRYDSRLVERSALGYELFSDIDHYEDLRRGLEETIELTKIPPLPIDVGRYPIVLTGSGAGTVLGESIVNALELDRILGYEANSTGTSYIQELNLREEPYSIGSKLLNLTTNRSSQGEIGTRKWDDEGTPTIQGSLVEDGVIKNTLSDNELSTVVSQKAMSSNAIASDARFPVGIRSGNVFMKPGDTDSTLEDLLKDHSRCLLFKNAQVGLDYQLTNGTLGGDIFEVMRGRKVSRVIGGGCWFKTQELWNNLVRLGGKSTLERTSIMSVKGEPLTAIPYSVTAPAVMIKDATIIDLGRK